MLDYALPGARCRGRVQLVVVVLVVGRWALAAHLAQVDCELWRLLVRVSGILIVKTVYDSLIQVNYNTIIGRGVIRAIAIVVDEVVHIGRHNRLRASHRHRPAIVQVITVAFCCVEAVSHILRGRYVAPAIVVYIIARKCGLSLLFTLHFFFVIQTEALSLGRTQAPLRLQELGLLWLMNAASVVVGGVDRRRQLVQGQDRRYSVQSAVIEGGCTLWLALNLEVGF